MSQPESPDRRQGPLERLNEVVKERLFGHAPHIGLIRLGEDLVHYAVAIVLIAVAGNVLYHTVVDLIHSRNFFPDGATNAINDVLFAIIVIEVMRTVVAHFERGGLQLQPFLIIGIISAVREILSVGARLSLTAARQTSTEIHNAMLELAVNAAVVVGLALALVLIRRVGGMREDG